VKARCLEDLEIFNDGRQLVQLVYRLTATPELRADFVLRDQLRKSAISVLSNIAEGFERDGNREFHQFLAHAKGSAGELRAQLLIASDLGHLSPSDLNAVTEAALRLSRGFRP
jgi:four helix bundle protein